METQTGPEYPHQLASEMQGLHDTPRSQHYEEPKARWRPGEPLGTGPFLHALNHYDQQTLGFYEIEALLII